MPNNYKVAYFITSHGFGHAARSAAIMQALSRLDISIHFDIYSRVPEWFIIDSFSGNYTYHDCLADIGLIQKNPLHADLELSLYALDNYLPYDELLLDNYAEELVEANCNLIISDISPLGIEISTRTNIPSILVENFTWDWIYEKYVDNYHQFGFYVNYFREIFEKVNYRIQANPVCNLLNSQLLVNPVSRDYRVSPETIRQQLKIPENKNVMLITMGGIQDRHSFIDQLPENSNVFFIIPGGSEMIFRGKSFVLLPHNSVYYHPDLINTAEIVIGKIGYSTLAETFYAGSTLGYIPRPGFRESDQLIPYIRENFNGYSIAESEFYSGLWTTQISQLMTFPRINRNVSNGADQAAVFIHNILNNKI